MKKAILTFLLLSLVAFADDDARPDENAMFGGGSSSSSPQTKDAFASGEATDNPLTIGGRYYQRMTAAFQDGVALGNTTTGSPLQFDGFLDSRPNDRLRGYMNVRMGFDPSGGSTTSSGSTATGLSASSTAPTVALDQAWLKFDIDRRVFVTVGKQSLKWGTGRFWNPTDLFNSIRRDPLMPLDLRTGNYMAKFHLPFEKQQANIYWVAMMQNPVAANTLGKLGGALRAESVVFGAEIGLDAFFRYGHAPTYGADISTPLGPFDVTGEVAVFTGHTNVYSAPDTIPANTELTTVITESTLSGPQAQASAGLSYSFAWKEGRQATLGVEYFYNSMGYTNARIYPVLMFLNVYQPLYTGRHYGAFYLTAEGPDAEKRTNYTLSTLANLSDASFITRLDFSWRVLTHLTFEAFTAVHYGTSGGEFRFSLDIPDLTYGGQSIAARQIPASAVDVGLGLRMTF